MSEKTLVVISDYGIGDPAFSEVILQLRTLLPGIFIHPQSVPPFSTLNTGFWIYQIALTSNLTNTHIFSNTAPRKENSNAQKNNSGEKLMYAKLQNGFEIMAVNAGFVFSFVKPFISSFHFVNSPFEGSQFRSRDIFPKSVSKMINNDASYLGEKADPALLPEYPKNIVASIDGYGNIKTTMRMSETTINSGNPVMLNIGGISKSAIFTDGSFNIPHGQLAFAPGSSGHDDRFMEIFYRGGSAAELFDLKKVEIPFELKQG